jgi:hypothetical protein
MATPFAYFERLPLELWQSVLRYVVHDISAPEELAMLVESLVVCRRWMVCTLYSVQTASKLMCTCQTITRQVLYEDIMILSPGKLHAFAQAMIDDESGALSCFVRSLGVAHTALDDAAPAAFWESIHTILSMVSRLRLFISCVTMSASVLVAITHKSRDTLRSLQISTDAVGSLKALRFLRVLEDLKVNLNPHGPHAETVPAWTLSIPTLRAFEFEFEGPAVSSALVQWLGASRVHPAATSLSLVLPSLLPETSLLLAPLFERHRFQTVRIRGEVGPLRALFASADEVHLDGCVPPPALFETKGPIPSDIYIHAWVLHRPAHYTALWAALDALLDTHPAVGSTVSTRIHLCGEGEHSFRWKPSTPVSNAQTQLIVKMLGYALSLSPRGIAILDSDEQGVTSIPVFGGRRGPDTCSHRSA